MKKYLWLLVAATAFGQNVRYDNIAFGPKGPIPNATIAVCTQPAATSTQPCTPLAMLCSSLTDATCNQPNPFFADALGNFHFYLKPVGSPVSIQIYGPGVAIPLVLIDQLAGVGTSGGGGGSVFPTSTISPSSLSFGSLALGSTSAAQVVTLTNTGTPQVSISSIAVSGDFAQSNNCGSILAQAASCTISVTFSPTVSGAEAGTLTVTSDAAGSPQNVSLNGTGLGNTGSPVTWSSAALTPATPTVIIPNTQQMTMTYTPSAGNPVNGTLSSYFQDTGGGAASSWALVNGPGNVPSYKTAFNTTASKPLGPITNTLNHLLVVKAMGYNAGGAQTFTISDTNVDTFTCTTLIQFSANTRNTQICSAVINATASNTITCAVSAGYSACEAEEWSGNATTTPLDVAAGQGGSGTANMGTPSFTTAGTNELITGHCYDPAGSGTDTPGTGYTTDFTITSGVAAIGEHQIASAAGAYSLSATDAATGQNWACDAAAFKPSTAGTGFFSTISSTGLVTAQSAGTSTLQGIGGTVAQTASSFVASGTTATVILSNPQTAGNTNVIKVSWGAATGSITSVADAAGNTYACQAPEQANALSVALCVASPIAAFSNANGNAVTVTMSGTTANLDVVAEERNFTAAASLLDGSAVNATGASGAATANITTVNATDVVVAGVGVAQTISTVNDPFTVDATSPGGDAIISGPAFAPGTLSPTANLSGGAWVLQTLALKVLGASTSATISTQAVTNAYFMAPSNASPPGNDSNACTQSLPCLSFAHILSLLKTNCPGANGCQVILENGIYNTANGTGFLGANCGSGGNAPNGTPTAPIIFQGQNERQAWLQGSGTTPLKLTNCSYWQFIGLHASDADNSGVTTPGAGEVFQMVNSQHNLLQRDIFDHNNRFGNNQVVSLESGSCNNTLIENEVYYFHRWGIMNYGNSCSAGNGNVFIRNYSNNRGFTNITGGYNNQGSIYSMGDYGGQSSIWVNNIAEDPSGAPSYVSALEEATITGAGASINNVFKGEMVNALPSGLHTQPHDNSPIEQNLACTNCLFNNVTLYGFNAANAFNMSCTNCTVVTTASTSQGFVAGSSGAAGLTGPYSSTVTNSIAYDNFGSADSTIGFDGVVGSGTWSFINGFSFHTPFNCQTVTCTNESTIKPSPDSCLAWVSTTSNMHGAGSAGADIGANILFEYDGSGNITATPLWSAAAQCKLGQTNCFVGTGAIVPGLNDVAGTSLFDVGTRFNINRNGCAYQTGYTPAP